MHSRGSALVDSLVAATIIGILVMAGLPRFLVGRDRAKIAEVEANMHRTQLAAEEFSTLADGLYPGGIRTTVQQVFPPSPYQFCIAGANVRPLPPNALIPRTTFKNPFNPSAPAVKNGFVAKLPSGCVYYCAYDQNRNRIGEGEGGFWYEVRGMGRYSPMVLVLHN